MADLFGLEGSAIQSNARVVAVRGREALSAPYEFDVWYVVPAATDAAHDEVPDLASHGDDVATLHVNDAHGAPRTTRKGIIASLELLDELPGADGLPGDALYRATLVPRLWRLQLTLRSRAFVGQSIPAIVRTILTEAGLAFGEDFTFRFDDSGAKYPPREFVCQYRESDFAFVSRLLEREGIYYYFDHAASDRERLVLADAPAQHANGPSSAVAFFASGAGLTSDTEAFGSFACRQRRVPQTLKLKDYDNRFAVDYVSMQSASTADSAHPDVYRFGDHPESAADAVRLARVRAEAMKVAAKTFTGSGRVFDTLVGWLFELHDHPRAEFNTRYLPVAQRTFGTDFGHDPRVARLVGMEADAANSFRVEVDSIAASVQFRPEMRTSVPRIHGVETALVDGPADSTYAQLDDQGRYRVKFKFDASDLAGGKASAPVRMLQPHGGSNEDFHFPLRAGTEVMVVFLDGDPDRPMIAGVVPNRLQPTAITAGSQSNRIHTGGDNVFELGDAAGGQFIDLSTPFKNTRLHLGSPTDEVLLKTDGNSRHDTGGDHHTWVGGKRVVRVNGTNEVTVDQDNALVIGQNHSGLTVGTSEDMFVGNKQELNVANFDGVTVGATAEVFLGARMELTAAAAVEVFTGAKTETVIGASQGTFIGASQETFLGASQETFMGAKQETNLAATNAITMGMATELYVGGKSETVVGATQEVFVGAKTELNVAGSKSITVGVSDELFAGEKIDITLGAALELVLGLSASFVLASAEYTKFELVEKDTEIHKSDSKVVQTSTHISISQALHMLKNAITMIQ